MSRLERWYIYICLSCESFYPERLRLHHALAGQKATGGLAFWSPIYLDREKIDGGRGDWRDREQCTYTRVECRLVATYVTVYVTLLIRRSAFDLLLGLN